MMHPNEATDSTAITSQPPASSGGADLAGAITGKRSATGVAAPAIKKISPAALAKRLFRFDMMLLALVLLLALFLGMFTAHNSDVFLHLSLGSPFGADADDSGWVHHAWLPSLILGAVYEPYVPDFHGRRHAILIKAIVVVVTTLFLCLIRRRGQSWLMPIVFAALAVLVISPRLLLQPVVISYLFLAVTIWILTMPTALHPRILWALPVLFALWVNMDEWFVLGPLTVALWLVGTWLQERFKIERAGPEEMGGSRVKALAAVLGVGLLACLINPWFQRALVLPAEMAYMVRFLPRGLVAAGQVLAESQAGDPQVARLLSPFHADYLSRPGIGLNTAGIAYFVLLLLGIVSFVLPAFNLKPERSGDGGAISRHRVNVSLLVVFLLFALLSGNSFRLIPFFAVVAGPIAALNFQDFLRRRQPSADVVTTAAFNLAFSSRAMALLGCVALLACAWPGWLHGNPGDWKSTRHVDWEVIEDPGVLQAAQLIGQIQQQTGLCKLGLSYSLEGGNLFAWPARHGEPTVRVIMDSRLALYGDRAAELGKIKKALREEAEILLGSPFKNEQEQKQGRERLDAARQAYQGGMRKLGMDYVVLTRLYADVPSQRLATLMMEDPWRQWVMLYHDGRTAVFAWVDPQQPQRDDIYRKYRLDLIQMSQSRQIPPNMPRVTLHRQGIAPAPMDMTDDWQRYLFGPAKVALSSMQAEQYISLYSGMSREWELNWAVHHQETVIGGVGVIGANALGVTAVSPLVIKRKDPQGKPFEEQFFRRRDLGPSPLPFYAVRSARNGILEESNDANAYATLGTAYRLLLLQDNFYAQQFNASLLAWPRPSLRHQFRLAQIIQAYQDAVTAQPHNFRLHGNLYEIYRMMDYLDLALEQLMLYREAIIEQKTPGANLPAIDKDIKSMTDEVRRRTDQFQVRVGEGTKDILQRFDAALIDHDNKDAQGRIYPRQRGVIKLALKELEDAKPEQLVSDPAKLRLVASWQLYLLLTTGQCREAYELLSEDKDHGKMLRSVLTGGEYEQLRAMAAAALGDYAVADRLLAEAEKARGLPPDEQVLEQTKKLQRQIVEHQAASAVLAPGLDGYVGALPRVGSVQVGPSELVKALQQPAKAQLELAELRLIRGSLALEAGDTAAAAQQFRGSLAIVPAYFVFADRPIAVRYLELLKQQ